MGVEMTPFMWAVVAGVAVVIALDKSLLPGASILGVGVLANVLPAKTSTGLTLALLIVADWTAIWAYRGNVDWRALRRLLPNVVIGVALGAVFLFLADNSLTRRVIGAIILVFITWNVVGMWRARRTVATRPPSSTPASRQTSGEGERAGRARGVLFGSLAGFTTMVANAGGPVTAVYFMTEGFPVRLFLGTTAWFYLVVNMVKLPFSIGLGMLTLSDVPVILAMVPVVVASVFVGRWLSGKVNATVFNSAVLVLAVVTAVMLLV